MFSLVNWQRPFYHCELDIVLTLIQRAPFVTGSQYGPSSTSFMGLLKAGYTRIGRECQHFMCTRYSRYQRRKIPQTIMMAKELKGSIFHSRPSPPPGYSYLALSQRKLGFVPWPFLHECRACLFRRYCWGSGVLRVTHKDHFVICQKRCEGSKAGGLLGHCGKRRGCLGGGGTEAQKSRDSCVISQYWIMKCF